MKKKIITGILCLCSLGLFAQEGEMYTVPVSGNGTTGMRNTRVLIKPKNPSGTSGLKTIRITVTPNKTAGSGGSEAWRVKQQQNERRLKDHEGRLASLESKEAETDSRLDRIERVVFSKKGQNTNQPRLRYPDNTGYNDGTGQGQYDNGYTPYTQRDNTNQYSRNGYNRNAYDNQYDARSQYENDRDRQRARTGRAVLIFIGCAVVATAVGLVIHQSNMSHQNNYTPTPAPTPTPTPTPNPPQPTSGTGGPGGNPTIY